MFTLCMSRGANKHIQDNAITTNHCGKQIKGGYLLRHKRGWLCRTWCEEWVVLYEDSTVAWFKDKGAAFPGGRIRLSDAPELLAVGEWTRQVPRRPRIPGDCHVGQLMALGGGTDYSGGDATGSYDGYGRKSKIHWLMAQSPAEVSDWMTAISNTLPPPPRLTIDRDKRCSITLTRDHHRCSNGYSNCSSLSHLSTQAYPAPSNVIDTLSARRRSYEGDHTVAPGVVIDWGHGWGWGWGDAAWAAQLACGNDAAAVAAATAAYCAAAEDYSTIGAGYDDVVDYSACGDFTF